MGSAVADVRVVVLVTAGVRRPLAGPNAMGAPWAGWCVDRRRTRPKVFVALAVVAGSVGRKRVWAAEPAVSAGRRCRGLSRASALDAASLIPNVADGDQGHVVTDGTIWFKYLLPDRTPIPASRVRVSRCAKSYVPPRGAEPAGTRQAWSSDPTSVRASSCVSSGTSMRGTPAQSAGGATEEDRGRFDELPHPTLVARHNASATSARAILTWFKALSRTARWESTATCRPGASSGRPSTCWNSAAQDIQEAASHAQDRGNDTQHAVAPTI